MSAASSLRSQPVRGVLDRLHAEARGDRWRFLGLAPRILAGLVARRDLWREVMTPASMRDCYIPVSREQGELLYLTARAIGARHVVEFGTSFGISTVYLAAAVRDNGGGLVIGSEIEASKQQQAVANLTEAGLAKVSDVRLGDALETLRDLPEPIDLVLLDGWKDLYLPILALVTPKLRPRAVVLADNIFTFRKSLRPYVAYVQGGDHGFVSTTLHVSDGFEYSVYVGK